MASKRRLRRNACKGKVRHETIAAANYAAHLKRQQTGHWIIGYGCQFCNGFHIGHPPKKVRQSINDKSRNAQ